MHERGKIPSSQHPRSLVSSLLRPICKLSSLIGDRFEYIVQKYTLQYTQHMLLAWSADVLRNNLLHSVWILFGIFLHLLMGWWTIFHVPRWVSPLVIWSYQPGAMGPVSSCFTRRWSVEHATHEGKVKICSNAEGWQAQKGWGNGDIPIHGVDGAGVKVV